MNHNNLLKKVKQFLRTLFIRVILPPLTKILDTVEKALSKFESLWPHLYQVFFSSGLFYTLLITGLTLIIAGLCR